MRHDWTSFMHRQLCSGQVSDIYAQTQEALTWRCAWRRWWRLLVIWFLLGEAMECLGCSRCCSWTWNSRVLLDHWILWTTPSWSNILQDNRMTVAASAYQKTNHLKTKNQTLLAGIQTSGSAGADGLTRNSVPRSLTWHWTMPAPGPFNLTGVQSSVNMEVAKVVLATTADPAWSCSSNIRCSVRVVKVLHCQTWELQAVRVLLLSTLCPTTGTTTCNETKTGLGPSSTADLHRT